MAVRLAIIEVEQQSEDAVLVNFNDGTFSSFSVTELAALHPQRAAGEGENAEPGQDVPAIAARPAPICLRSGRL